MFSPAEALWFGGACRVCIGAGFEPMAGACVFNVPNILSCLGLCAPVTRTRSITTRSETDGPAGRKKALFKVARLLRSITILDTPGCNAPLRMAPAKLPGGEEGVPARQSKAGKSITRRGGFCRTNARKSARRDRSSTMRVLSGSVPIRSEFTLRSAALLLSGSNTEKNARRTIKRVRKRVTNRFRK